jgi:hypothetical protein
VIKRNQLCAPVKPKITFNRNKEVPLLAMPL